VRVHTQLELNGLTIDPCTFSLQAADAALNAEQWRMSEEVDAAVQRADMLLRRAHEAEEEHAQKLAEEQQLHEVQNLERALKNIFLIQV